MRTLVEILTTRRSDENVGITFIESKGLSKFISYHELYDLALRRLHHFRSEGLLPGNELVLQIEDNEKFVIAFWACILGGIIPVPLAPCHNDDRKHKLFNVWSLLNDPYLYLPSRDLVKLHSFALDHLLESQFNELQGKVLDSDQELPQGSAQSVFEAEADDIAYVQFSSGSTGNPKGVILTHRNLLVNMNAIATSARYSSEDSMLSWMPLTHDMGLIGLHLNPLFSGMNQYLMPTHLFVRRPSLWMDKASEHRTTILGSPNFGYKYLLKHCKFDTQDWDLSNIRLIYNGAEPISEKIGDEFGQALSSFGLKKGVIRPVYGLAEASLAVTISGLSEEIKPVYLERDKLNIGDTANPTTAGDHSVSFVNVGSPIPDCRLRIVDDNDLAVPEGVIGHVQVSGENVTQGYYNNQLATRALITHDQWRRTGDLGFLVNHDLYITGRAKDIFFINGQNFYPHDIERLCEHIEGVELNKIVVGGFFDEEREEEKVVCFIFHRGALEKFIPLAEAVRSHVNSVAGIVIDHILPVPDIPRTTSGKLQRYKLVEKFRNGDFQETQEALRGILLGKITKESDSLPGFSQDESELQLTEIWESVLQRRPIGPNEEFLSVGGNSLKAAEITMSILKKFEIDLGLDVFYQKTTIRSLAKQIEGQKEQVYLPIERCAGQETYNASSAQKRLYALWETNRSSVAYNIPIAIRLQGEIDQQRLGDALSKLIERHEVLRTVYEFHDEPRVRIIDHVDFQLKVTPCQKEGVDRVLKQMIKPFDLHDGPLFRAELLSMSPMEFILFLDFHHSISDGVSVFNFIRELFRAYQGETLSSPTIDYRDFAVWEASNVPEEHEQFWKEYIGTEVPVLNLATDLPRPVTFDTHGARIAFDLDNKAYLGLVALAKANDCTTHAVLFSMYALALHYYSGNQELVIGIPVAGRNHPGILEMHGMFVNNLPVKVDLGTGTGSFETYLQHVKHDLKRVLAHQHYPYEQLRQNITQKRDVSRNVLFDTMFNYHNMGFPAVEIPGVSISRHYFDPGFSKFDLSLEIFESNGELNCGLEYATSLFHKETMLGFVQIFKLLVKSFLQYPKNDITQVNLLDDRTYQHHVVDFNNTDHAYPEAKTVHQLFEEQVVKNGSVPALQFENKTISYTSLNDRANLLAHNLRKEGVKAGKVVGVVMPRSPQFITSVFGILKSGGCFLPLDINLPGERIRYILKDSQCEHVVTFGPYVDQVRGLLHGDDNPLALSVIDIDALQEGTFVTNEISSIGNPNELAYIIYTSGTTGGPKGVMVENQSLVNYITWTHRTYLGDEPVAFPLYTSISFDLTITSIFTPLTSGNTLHIYEEEDEVLVRKVIQDGKVNVVKMTPSHLALLKDLQLPASTKKKLRRLVVGGEALETQLAHEIHKMFNGQVEIFNEYGPTEATVGCMVHLFKPGATSQTVPIGHPIANTRAFVLDRYLRPVPQGVLGELYISGAGLARGYLGQENLTNSKFVNNPFHMGERMYKTGDLVKRNAEGDLEFYRRIDHQLKIDGYRVEIQEIEHCLQEHEAIRSAILVARKNDRGRTMLWTYYVAHTAGVDEFELRAFVVGKLPHYMVPAYFIQLERIPLTRNGKVDYDALPQDLPGSRDSHIAPNDTLLIIHDVWREVLGVDEIAADQNFFELGGDSIKSIQIVNRLEEKGIALETHHIFTYQTLELLSQYARVSSSKILYPQGRLEGKFPLSPMVNWFLKQEPAYPGYYNQSLLLDLNSNIDEDLLQKSLRVVIEHHDGLRLNYCAEDGTLFYNDQHDGKEFTLEIHQLEDEKELAPCCQRIKKSLDLLGGWLVKSALISTKGAAKKLFIVAHHFIIDGVSWRIFIEDLSRVYRSLVDHVAPGLPPKTAPVSQWSNFLQEYGDVGVTHRDIEYWQAVEHHEFELPQDFTTKKGDWIAENTRYEHVTIDEENTTYLLKHSHDVYQADVPILLSTALAMAIHEWTGQGLVKLEVENHGRHFNDIDLSRTIGWFAAMYPVILTVSSDSIGDSIKLIKEQLRSVPSHGTGYGVLASIGKLPFQTLREVRLNYLGQFDTDLVNEWFSYSSRYHGADTHALNPVSSKLVLDILVIKGQLQVQMAYNMKAYRQSTLLKFSHLFKQSLLLVLDHLKGEESVHFTPSDFDGADLDQEEIEAIFE